MADRVDYNYEKIFINGLAYVHGSNLLYDDLFSTPYNGQYKSYTLESDPNSSKWAIIPYGYEFSRRFTYNASINTVKEEPRKFYIGTDESNLKEYTSVEGKAFEYDISAVDDDFVISFDMTNDFGTKYKTISFCNSLDRSNYDKESTSDTRFYPFIKFKVKDVNDKDKTYTIYRTLSDGSPDANTAKNGYGILIDEDLSDTDKLDSIKKQYDAPNRAVYEDIWHVTVSSLGVVCGGETSYLTSDNPTQFGDFHKLTMIKYFNFYDYYYSVDASGTVSKVSIDRTHSQFKNYSDREWKVYLNYGTFGYQDSNTTDIKYLNDFFSNTNTGKIDTDMINSLLGNTTDTTEVSSCCYRNYGDLYPWVTKQSKANIVKDTVSLKDTYSSIDRWFRCISTKDSNNNIILKTYGNTDPKFTAPTDISEGDSLFSTTVTNVDKAAHLKDKLVFDYPDIFKTYNGKACFNDGFLHFRMRLSSLPASGDVLLAQFCGITVGYSIDDERIFICPESITGTNFTTGREVDTLTTKITKDKLIAPFSLDIVILDKDYGIYFNKNLALLSSSNYVPAMTTDKIAYTDPIIAPSVEYDIDDILVCYTRCDALI